MKSAIFNLLIAITFLGCNAPKECYDVICQMKNKYDNHFYKHFTCSKIINKFNNDGLYYTGFWHEVYSFPNHLVIKFEDLGSGSGYVYRNDSMFVFEDGKMILAKKRIHDLITLGLDVYGVSAEHTFQ